MIPREVKAAHIIDALAIIDRDGVPKGRHGRGYELLHDGRHYPPKYAVALAAQLATGTVLDSESFGGGAETNGFLERLGFTVALKGSTAPRTPAQASAGSVRVGRVFLDLGVRQGAYRGMPEGKARAFEKLSRKQFTRSPTAYRDRMVDLIRRAYAARATVVTLPACALRVSAKVKLDAYRVPEVPWVVAGGADDRGEFAVVLEHGEEVARFEAARVHWLDAGSFTLMAAISSTIGQAVEAKHVPPVHSTTHPPDPTRPVLVVDVGHAQYSSRYDFNTLRCVARDVEARVGQPTGLVLSSWMRSTMGIGPRWCHPANRMQVHRRTFHGDFLDVIDVNLSGRSGATLDGDRRP